MIIAVIGLSAIFPSEAPQLALTWCLEGAVSGRTQLYCPLAAFLVVLPDVSDRMVGNLNNDGLAKEAR